MKSTFCILASIAILLNSCGPTYVTVHDSPPPVQAPAPVAEEVSYQTFYDELSPYGQWVEYPGYGYVWAPNVGYDFKPYATNGHWVYSEDGWVWASDYNWGWATFHYGRWFFDNSYGWLWVPGYEWAPAWVSWRQSNDYYGWAPLSPGINAGASIVSYNPPNNYWCFVQHQYIASPTVNNYYESQTKNVTIINNTTIINNNVANNYNINNSRTTNIVKNNYYAAGPDPNEVSRATGTTLRPVAISNSNTPGQQFNNGKLSMFRPRVSPNTSAGNANNGSQQQHAAPRKVQPLNNLRPLANANNNPANSQHNDNPTRQENKPNNAPANNDPQLNRPNNTNPSTDEKPNLPVNNNQPVKPITQTPVNTNKPPNGNGQPNNSDPNNNRQLNKPNNNQPNNNQPNIPANGHPNNNRSAGTQNQPNSQSNKNGQAQQQSQNQVKPQQNQQPRQTVNKPTVKKDSTQKEKPKGGRIQQ